VFTTRIALPAVAVVLAVTATFASAGTATSAPSPRTFDNCTALNKVYPHGVGRPGARDRTSGTPVTTFKRSTALYNANSKSDRDKDGVACEKA
jgi:hypothetical protein